MMSLPDRVGGKSQVPAAAANLRLWVGQGGVGVLKSSYCEEVLYFDQQGLKLPLTLLPSWPTRTKRMDESIIDLLG
jgi:hypothetical protein